MLPRSRVLAASFAALLSGAGLCAAETRGPQYVLISFDGANSIALWDRSLKLADATGARFTYFLSCVYLLSPEDRTLYRGPGKAAGRSNVGFAASREDATQRLARIWAASQTGHEIASHGCGHFDGKDWSKADWRTEFGQFSTVFRKAWEINGATAPAGWADFAAHGVKGFRVPYLSTGSALDGALKEAGFAYDASGVSRGPQPPVEAGARAEFALPMIPEGPSARRIIAMDYNLFVRHSGGIDRPSQADEFAERSYQAFAAAFRSEYDGARVPLQMGFHFTLMNGGAYWTALERFAAEFCVKPDVRCVSYGDYLRERRPGDAAAIAAAGG
ncbi:MAG: polysaccharide deacetylase [Mesorhizobium sp.]|nr:polysaccharide deacetylase [Mesorhizobium sp.]